MLEYSLLNSIEEVYFNGECNCHTGYNIISLIEMIQYLYDNCSVLTPEELAENYKRMREAYDPIKPIENLFEQIEETVEYADAESATYNDKQILSKT